jgi:hypothetical protein
MRACAFASFPFITFHHSYRSPQAAPFFSLRGCHPTVPIPDPLFLRLSFLFSFLSRARLRALPSSHGPLYRTPCCWCCWCWCWCWWQGHGGAPGCGCGYGCGCGCGCRLPSAIRCAVPVPLIPRSHRHRRRRLRRRLARRQDGDGRAGHLRQALLGGGLADLVPLLVAAVAERAAEDGAQVALHA